MKWFGFALLILTIGIVVLLGLGEREETARLQQTPSEPSMSGPKSARSQMEGIQLIEQTDRETAWRVWAEQAEFSDNANLAIARGVRAKLFQEDKALLSLEANRSVVRRDTGNITMQDGVRILHEGGYTMTTKTLDWLAEARQLHTDAAVELEGPSVHITGVGLQSEVDEQRFHLEHNVHASFRLR